MHFEADTSKSPEMVFFSQFVKCQEAKSNQGQMSTIVLWALYAKVVFQNFRKGMLFTPSEKHSLSKNLEDIEMVARNDGHTNANSTVFFYTVQRRYNILSFVRCVCSELYTLED